ncbi:MAG: hypothetical protein ABI551_17950 [Polyangiaceae bacterium]
MSDSKKTDEAATQDGPLAHTEGDAEHEQRRPTVPPPAGDSDAYSAETVIRDVPPEVLDVIRQEKAKSEKKLASEHLPSDPAEPKVTLVPTGAEVTNEEDAVDLNKVTARVDASVVALEREKAELEAERSRAARDNIAAAERVADRTTMPVLAPVDPGGLAYPPPLSPRELLYALAGAIVAIIVGFYVVNAFI